MFSRSSSSFRRSLSCCNCGTRQKANQFKREQEGKRESGRFLNIAGVHGVFVGSRSVEFSHPPPRHAAGTRPHGPLLTGQRERGRSGRQHEPLRYDTGYHRRRGWKQNNMTFNATQVPVAHKLRRVLPTYCCTLLIFYFWTQATMQPQAYYIPVCTIEAHDSLGHTNLRALLVLPHDKYCCCITGLCFPPSAETNLPQLLNLTASSRTSPSLTAILVSFKFYLYTEGPIPALWGQRFGTANL